MGASNGDPQNARTIAYAVARGWFDIVADKEFDKAKSHDDMWNKHNAERAERELANMQVPAAGTIIDVMAQQIAKLTSKVAILEGTAK